jgi:hypothetical protein
MIDLTNTELFKDLTTIESKDKSFDLHNDYDCILIDYDVKKRVLIIDLKRNGREKGDKLRLQFENASIAKLELHSTESQDSGTISSFYRGRFEINGILSEYSSQGERYFYIEFEDGKKIELFANFARLITTGAKK